MPGEPRPASTVVLLRPSNSRFDVCLVRRHDEVAFMGGAHVFPGGRVDAADRINPPESLCDGVAAATARMADVPPADAVAHSVAAVRELFEEAGILLARRASGAAMRFAHSDERLRFAAYRSSLADGTVTIREIAEREQLRLALDALVMFAHWVTPEIEIKRYDVRFFVTAAPEGQEPVHDNAETTSCVWLDPSEAIERCRTGQLALPPPTWTTLRMLEQFTSIDEVFVWARNRRVARVQPNFSKQERGSMLTLPGDPLYPGSPDVEPLRETRFMLEDGRWRAVPASSSGAPRRQHESS